MYAFGDVLIIHFPYSDGQGTKRRPVLVVRDTEDGDVLVAKITSQVYASSFDVALRDWQQVNLLSPSCVRIHKMQTLYTRLVFG